MYTKYDEYNGKSVLLLACDNNDVTEESMSCLLDFMISKFEKIDCIDEYRYGWEPIHYVSKNAHPGKLKILIDKLGGSNINSLTYFSENALHVLLQYEKSVAPFDIVLNNGIESTPCTITSTESENLMECAKILIGNGIDINCANFWNETPICLAIKLGQSKVIRELQNYSYIDLDNYFVSGQTVRKYLSNKTYQNTVAQYGGFEDPITKLFYFLKSGDEDGFVHFEGINDFVDTDDGSGTMLQFCLRKGFLEYLQDECYKKEYKESDIKSSPMLKTFCKKGLSRCIEYLLDNGADPSILSTKFRVPLLEYAAMRGYYPFVAILLDHHDSKIHPDDIFSVLKKLLKNNLEFKNGKFYEKCVLYLLLNKLIATFSKSDLTSDKLKVLNRTLCKLVKNNSKSEQYTNIESELIFQILHLGANLTEQDAKGEMIIDSLPEDMLKDHFDDCIEDNVFKYDTIVQDFNNQYSETKTIDFLMSSKNKQELLVHPIFIHFIGEKWSRIAWVFYLDLLFYFLFLFSIWVYMVSLHTNLTNIYSTYIIYTLCSIHLFKESFQLIFLYHWQYLTDSSNLLEVIVVISCLVTFIIPNVYSMIVAILFATLISFIMLGQLPTFSKYTIIFGSAKYFLEYTGFYFIQFLSFAICFYIIFPFETQGQQSNTPIHSPDAKNLTAGLFKSLFLTMIYFTGEFSDRVLEPADFPVFGRVIMTLFIFCMTIILNNLLVGLIVTDMDDIQKSGKLYKQVKLAKFIRRTDTFIKRIHDFKSLDFIKEIIYRIQIFKKNTVKFLSIVDVNDFDDDTKEYLNDLKTTKSNVFDRNVLTNTYQFIRNNNR
ncbi:hypothetical protein JTB14_024577 [Gonioctena quinquepunctata]|nr:hypothetical protein JTB14_024577 [Gonioctena quinquepunctata]